MPLRVLDLRGTPPPYDDVLPRPDAPGADVHDAVAGILAEVRDEGDAAVIRHTAAFDGVDVAAGLRVGPAEIKEAAERVTPAAARRPGDGLRRASSAYHAHEGTPPGDHVDGGITVRHLTRPVAGPGSTRRAAGPATPRPCSCAPPRPGWPGSAPSPCACRRPPTARWTTPRCARPTSPASTRCTASAAPRPSAPWPTARRRSPRSTSSPGPGNAYVAEAKRQVSGVVGVASAFAGPSEIVVVAGPVGLPGLRRHRPRRPGRARSRRAGLAGHLGRRPARGGGRPRSAASSPPRPPGRPRVHAGHRRASPAWSTGPTRRWPWPTPWRPSTCS